MKCPKCENEMEKGFVQSIHQIYFSAKKHKLHLAPTSADIKLTGSNFDVPNAEAWCCKRCKKVVIDY